MDLAKAVCTICAAVEEISLSAWIRGQNFKHCDSLMRVHVDSPEQAQEAIDAALDDGLSQAEIVGRLAAGITDAPVEAPPPVAIEGDMGGLHEQLRAQIVTQADQRIHGRHHTGAAPVSPLQRWAHAAAMRLHRPEQPYTVVVSAGPLENGTEAIAIAVVNHDDQDVQVARMVIRPCPDPTDAWLARQIQRVLDLARP